MNKMKDLQMTLDQMIQCGEGMIAATNALKEIFSETTEVRPETPEPKQSAKEPAAPKKEIKLTDIRGVLAEKSRAGFTAQVKELLTKYGTDKLSAVDPKNYEALLADAEVLGNG